MSENGTDWLQFPEDRSTDKSLISVKEMSYLNTCAEASVTDSLSVEERYSTGKRGSPM